MRFTIQAEDPYSQARTGWFQTAHGIVPTPVFMPVGTLGSVKALHQREIIQDIEAPIILANTYHLYLRPGAKVLAAAGGLHRFIHWDGPILTDSGGYQVHSLATTRTISEKGVHFKSPIDGSQHLFTPENVVDMQCTIGSDIIMPLDECTPGNCSYDYAANSLARTQRWFQRAKRQWQQTNEKAKYPQYLFPIIQGALYKDLREAATLAAVEENMPGHAVGGICHPTGQLYSVTRWVCDLLPKNKPRYLMGVGRPEDLLTCIALGVDMFDCVMPTRNGRNGYLFTAEGIINIKQQRWRYDFSPIDKRLGGYASTHYSKAYLHHLIRTKERLGAQIATLHNLRFYTWLMKEAREKIKKGDYTCWQAKIIPQLKCQVR